LVEQTVKRKTTKANLRNLISRIARAEGYRHRIAHGLWSYNPKRLGQLWAIDRRRKHVEPFDVPKLVSFAESIGELSFELIHPGGWRLSLVMQHDKATGHSFGGGTPRSLLLRLENRKKLTKRMDELALLYSRTHDQKVKAELDKLSSQLSALDKTLP
jgi:hypothetical protein